MEKAMAQMTVIKAAARPKSGKGAARAVRREGSVPAVIYGDQKTAETITIGRHDLDVLLLRGRFLKSVFELDIDGKKLKVVPREVQVDPVRDFPIHVDFQRIGADNRVRIAVPMKFTNEAASPGLKRGGVLDIVRREVEVWCPADKIPEFFELDLTGLEIGRSVHISAVKLPADVKPVIHDRDFTVATIAGKKAEEEAKTEATADAAAAPGAAAPAAGDGKAAAPAAGGKPGAAAPAAGGKAAPAAAAKPAAKK
jgi:large subunit ribosomal protein L25